MSTQTDAPPFTPVCPPASLAIETAELSRRFGPVAALEGIDLRVERGRTYGLLGLNGAGKSTLIRVLVGLLAPHAGRVLINGIDPARDSVRAIAGVGYVPDRPAAYAWMKVGEVIRFARAMWPAWDDALAGELLERYRLDPARRVGKLSKGTAAKLSLLLALAHDPDVLILDEPTDGLDPLARDEFLEQVVGALCRRPRTVLISSHALADVQRLADVIGVMHGGRLLMQAPAQELLASSKRARMVLESGTPPALPAGLAGVLRSHAEGRAWSVTLRRADNAALALLRSTAGVRSLEVEDLTLDELFKDIVRGREGTR